MSDYAPPPYLPLSYTALSTASSKYSKYWLLRDADKIYELQLDAPAIPDFYYVYET